MFRSSGRSLLRLSSNRQRAPAQRSWSYSANLKDHASNVRPIDICTNISVATSTKVELFAKDKDEEQSSSNLNLRAGMVLLKKYITLDEQVAVVRECRRLGLGPGGFYKMNTRRMLMCLGHDWDPKTSSFLNSATERSKAVELPKSFSDNSDRPAELPKPPLRL